MAICGKNILAASNKVSVMPAYSGIQFLDSGAEGITSWTFAGMTTQTFGNDTFLI